MVSIRLLHHFYTSKTIVNGIFLLLGSLVVGPLGFVFWVLATRYYDEATIGVIASILQLLLWIAGFSRMGFADGLSRFLPEGNSDENSTLINTTIVFSLITTIPILAIFLVIIFFLINNYPNWVWSWQIILLIVINTFGINFGTILDNVSIGFSSSYIVVIKSILIGVVKLILLPLFATLQYSGILLASDIAFFIPLLAIWFVLSKKQFKGYKIWTSPKINSLNKIRNYSLKFYIQGLASKAPASMLPLIVIALMSRETAAYFAIGWLLIELTYALPVSIGTSLMVETVKERKHLLRNILLSFLFIFGFLFFIILLFFFVGNYVLLLFGKNYTTAFSFVFLSLFSAFPYTLNTLYFNYCKITKKMNLLIGYNLVQSLLILVGSFVLISILGLNGIALMLITANSFVSILLFILNFKSFKNVFKKIKDERDAILSLNN